MKQKTLCMLVLLLSTIQGALGFEGSGTEEDPYLISSVEDWDEIANRWNSGGSFEGTYFLLTNDISGVTTQWGTDERPFSNTFDGGGHTLNVNINGGDYAAPFNTVKGARIKHVHVTGTVSGGLHAAGLVGHCQDMQALVLSKTVIEDCRVSAAITSSTSGDNGPHAGGFIGHGQHARIDIQGCLFDGNITAVPADHTDSYAAPFIGWCEYLENNLEHDYERKLIDCFERGSYPGFKNSALFYICRSSDYIIGFQNRMKVANTYHSQAWDDGHHGYTITSGTYGLNLNLSRQTQYETSGIWAAAQEQGVTVDGLYYSNSGNKVGFSVTYDEGIAYDTSKLTASTGTLNNSSAQKMLTMDAADCVIYVDIERWNDHRAEKFSNIQGKTITITTPEELALLAYNCNTDQNYSGWTIKLGADLDMSEYRWSPIGEVRNGRAEGDSYFQGTFDGQGHTISGLIYMESTTGHYYGGLIGRCNGGTVKDVKIVASSFLNNYSNSANRFLGPVAGVITDGTVRDCVVGSDVTVSCNAIGTEPLHVGGVVGNAHKSKVVACVSAASVSTNDHTYCYSGGIAGYASPNSFSTGTNVGTVDILHCLYLGHDVDGNKTGAVVGYHNANDDNIKIENCYYRDAVFDSQPGDGSRAYTVTPSDDVAFKIGYSDTEYKDDYFVKAYQCGLFYDDVFYAPQHWGTDYYATNNNELPLYFYIPNTTDGNTYYIQNAVCRKSNGEQVSFYSHITRDASHFAIDGTTDYVITAPKALVLGNEATDNSAKLQEAGAEEEYNVVFDNRKYIINNKWNTICLPFDVEKSAFMYPDNMKIMALQSSSYSGGTLTLDFSEADKIVAGTPCLVKWEGVIQLEVTTGSLPVFQGVKIAKPAPVDVETTATTFKGSYDLVEIAGEDKTMLYMGANSTLYYPNDAMNIGAFRAYFKLADGLTAGEPIESTGQQAIRAFKLNFGDGETTGVTIPLALQRETGGEAWFTLDGRQLNGKPTQKGVFVHDGKKTVIY